MNRKQRKIGVSGSYKNYNVKVLGRPQYHDLLGAIIKKNQQRFPYRTIHKRNYAKYDKEHFLADLKAVPWGTVIQHADTNRAWETFKRLLKEIIDKYAPLIKKLVRGKDCPWINNLVRSKMNERDYYLKRARKSGKENDLSSYHRLRNTVTRLIRHSKATYTRSILRAIIERPAQF